MTLLHRTLLGLRRLISHRSSQCSSRDCYELSLRNVKNAPRSIQLPAKTLTRVYVSQLSRTRNAVKEFLNAD